MQSITLADASLDIKLCHLDLNPSMYNTLKAKRKATGNPAWYPVMHSKIWTFAFDGQTIKFEKDDVFVGEVADLMVVGLLDSRAFNGCLTRLPSRHSG